MRLKRISIFVVIVAVITAVFTPAASAANDTAQRVPVLMYHSVLGEKYYASNADNPWILSEENFAAQMKYLKDNGYSTITTEQLTGFLFDKKDLPEKAVMLTFDDAYLDSAVFVYPILKEYSFTGVVFAITSFITATAGTLKAYPLQYMSTDDMKNTADVFEFGSHSDNMHYLDKGVPRMARASKAEIKADLEKSFEYPLTFKNGFAYPYGKYNDLIKTALKEEGIRFAFTTNEGYVYRTSAPLSLNRFFISGDMGIGKFTEIVSGGRTGPSAATGAGTVRTVGVTALNVRSGAGTKYKVVGVVRVGDTVSVLATTGSWSKISWQGGAAYVYSEYLK